MSEQDNVVAVDIGSYAIKAGLCVGDEEARVFRSIAETSRSSGVVPIPGAVQI